MKGHNNERYYIINQAIEDGVLPPYTKAELYNCDGKFIHMYTCNKSIHLENTIATDEQWAPQRSHNLAVETQMKIPDKVLMWNKHATVNAHTMFTCVCCHITNVLKMLITQLVMHIKTIKYNSEYMYTKDA